MGAFHEVAKANLYENKNIVISIKGDNTIVIAKQLVFNDNGKVIEVYEKNTIEVDLAGLKKIKEVIEEALKILSK